MVRNPTGNQRQGLEEGGARSGGERSIFRAEALNRYAQNQERAVFPRLVSPRSFRLLWVLAGIFLVSGLLIAFWPFIGPLLAGAS